MNTNTYINVYFHCQEINDKFNRLNLYLYSLILLNCSVYIVSEISLISQFVPLRQRREKELVSEQISLFSPLLYVG